MATSLMNSSKRVSSLFIVRLCTFLKLESPCSLNGKELLKKFNISPIVLCIKKKSLSAGEWVNDDRNSLLGELLLQVIFLYTQSSYAFSYRNRILFSTTAILTMPWTKTLSGCIYLSDFNFSLSHLLSAPLLISRSRSSSSSPPALQLDFPSVPLSYRQILSPLLFSLWCSSSPLALSTRNVFCIN